MDQTLDQNLIDDSLDKNDPYLNEINDYDADKMYLFTRTRTTKTGISHKTFGILIFFGAESN